METVLDQKDERGVKAMLLQELDLAQVLDRDVEHLSGARSLSMRGGWQVLLCNVSCCGL